MRKKSAYRQKYGKYGGINLLRCSQVFSNEEFASVSVEGRLAFQRIKEGFGTEEDVEGLWSLTHALQFRAQPIGSSAVEIAKKATQAANRTRERFKATGKVGFDGPALSELADALDLFDEFLRNSDIGRIVGALEKTFELRNAA